MSRCRSARPSGAWEKDYLCLLPDAGTAAREQDQECLVGLRAAVRERGLGSGDVAKMTFFIRAAGPADYLRRKRAVAESLRAIIPGTRPAASVVVQPPGQGREMALEAVVLRRPSRSVEVIPKSYRGVPYILVRGAGGREVYGAGISGGRSGNIGVRAAASFAKAAGILAREGLSFSDIVRQWNFIENILGGPGRGRRRRQNYQIFNDIRALTYDRADFQTGYPAATGIGTGGGGFILEFIAAGGAAVERSFAVSNPLQADAHRYSSEVLVGPPSVGRSGKLTPRFERARVVLRGDSGTCYVSGTAAIVGQDVVCRGDVIGQTRATIRNIERLVAPANLRRAGAPVSSLGSRFSYLRAYVKREGDMAQVRTVLLDSFKGAPALFVQADVCRPDLLVEIEGAVEVRTD